MLRLDKVDGLHVFSFERHTNVDFVKPIVESGTLTDEFVVPEPVAFDFDIGVFGTFFVIDYNEYVSPILCLGVVLCLQEFLSCHIISPPPTLFVAPQMWDGGWLLIVCYICVSHVSFVVHPKVNGIVLV